MTNPDAIDLAGPWYCALDPDDRGLAEGWARRTRNDLAVAGVLPGTTDLLGLGTPVQGGTPAHPARRFHYEGPVWWWREVEISEAWAGRRLELELERVHGRSDLFVDGIRVGDRDSLSVPHVYGLSRLHRGLALRPGRHVLALRTDNRVALALGDAFDNPEPVAHSVSEHTQSNWNGVVGRMQLRARPRRWLRQVAVRPLADLRRVAVAVEVGNDGEAGPADLTLVVRGPDGSVVARTVAALPACPHPEAEVLRRVELELDLGPAARTWDEFDPCCYELETAIAGPGGDERERRPFGLRFFARDGRRLVINGRPLFLRGTLECCQFPLTGHPPAGEAEWERIMAALRAHGLNHLRFHSWCPPEAAFATADRAGIYLQVEGPVWTRPGQRDGVDRFLLAETRAMLAAYGHHPSFALLVHGNEPMGGESVWFLSEWITEARRLGGEGRLYGGASGWLCPEPGDLFLGAAVEHAGGTPAPADPLLRLHQWGHGLAGPLVAGDRGTRYDLGGVAWSPLPTVAHEVGQWQSLPPVAEAARWTGALDAANLRWFASSLERSGLLAQAGEFLRAGTPLQLACYQAEIEAQLAASGHSGFQLLGLTDFIGQGTATVGVLDCFWEAKPGHDPERWRGFCAPTVPLARFDRHVWTRGERLAVDWELAHFGPRPLAGAVIHWRLDVEGRMLVEGFTAAMAVAVGNGHRLGACTIDTATLPELPVRAALRLDATVVDADGRIHGRNRWDLWLLPAEPSPDPAGVLVAECLDEALARHLAAGGRALLALDPDHVDNPDQGSWPPVFWNPGWTQDQYPRQHGLLIEDRHPALALVPTAGHSDWQWHDPVSRSRALVLDHLPACRPIVQAIDGCYRNRRLGLVLECAVGPGHLVVAATDLRGDLGRRPLARQLRHSLLAYLASVPALPELELKLDQLRRCLR